MEEEFIVQSIALSVLMLALVWFLNPFPQFNLRANPMNYLLLFSCSMTSLVMLQFGEKEFKTRISFESFTLFLGVVVLAAVLSYSVLEYNIPLFLTPYPTLSAIFFLLPIIQLFVKERL
jgi:hypothetical protein